ncbi:MAG: hypothetical protein CMB80_34760 [Flammeovirgaceae bacterium]|nr:hypothetical protein [Flammeovirgaceae bacterium]|tara:strand:+ start:710 stop:1279 length:570 start_codon:yes stop_codon:yes gene_type:complete
MSKFGSFNASISHKNLIYIDEDGVEFHGDKFTHMLKRIHDYRLDNGGDLALGWQDRVGDRLCAQMKLPACTKFKSPPRKLSVSDIGTFFSAVNKWRRSGYAVVDQEEADRRAAICAQCPKNVKIEGCTGCFRLLQKVKDAIGESKTSSDHLLKGCEVCACSLQAKVWLPKEVGHVNGKEQEWPDHCWLK